ncbi:MAG: HGGxSTG domain-containing protein [Sulfuritalea sp.]|nr:HGGxSTG domain-containing protein [Sulfuritalea sp.]
MDADPLRALLRAKLNRCDRLQAMIALLGTDGVIDLVMDAAEKWGIVGAIDRYRLPLLATMALLQGKPYTEPKRKICGARCRTGLPCQAKARPKSGRCRMHGNGGPRTPAGKARAMENLKLRWNR